MLKRSFPPIVAPNARILMLGSLPGDLSLRQQEYYAHPQNRFWKILSQLAHRPEPNSYQQKIALLAAMDIALWDVCHSALRPGSMDTAITEVEVNAIPALLERYPGIKHVFFNGQKAEKLYRQYLPPLPHISYHTLPSSSPANAQFSLPKLISIWAQLKSIS
ncbi:DNA-deoxyinosine glycosylase [Sphingobacterium sp. Mn56C]|uniref:DNA-deoxyinosine glycosylase n=1 Tax=Sphingobacterium sp. Mn56C TaxID=3395261 RepID=UPI003BCA8469